MIGAFWRRDGDQAQYVRRFANSLRCPAHGRIAIEPAGGAILVAAGTNLPDPARSSGSVCCPTAFHGRIHNRTAIADRLGVDRQSSSAALYEAALARWGDQADLELVGNYCAITVLPDATLRLVRSPWFAPPLHFVAGHDAIIASTVMAALFEAGHARQVDYDYVVDQLVQDHHDGEIADWYVGVNRVPIGSRIIAGPDRRQVSRYYDPAAIPPVRLRDDDAYLEAARALMGEAARAALEGAARPALMLSGGLDSPIVAKALLDALPPEARLPTFTFVPVPEWDGIVPDDRMGDERALVEAFAALHPRIDARFADPAMGGHDFRLRDLLAASGGPTANIANVGVFHGPWQAAKDAGCDTMLNADLGNFTFSNEAPWAYSEFFTRGRFVALYRALRGRRADPRPIWRKAVSLAIMPLLPKWLRIRIKACANPHLANMPGLVSALTLRAREAQQTRAAQRGGEALQADQHAPMNREEWIWQAWYSCDSGEDIDLAFERLYGIERRDVTAYRPLIEFCMGLPTDQYMRNGTARWLAKRLGAGIVPDAQLHNPRYGLHNADWHARLGQRRAEILDYLDRIRSHPFLGTAIDIDRLQALVDEWPESTSVDPVTQKPRQFALTRALTAAAFIGYAEGRNDL